MAFSFNKHAGPGTDSSYENTLYLKLAKLWLVSVLIILPFQSKIAANIAPWSGKLSTILNYMDELTIIIFLLLAIVVYCKDKKPIYGFFFCCHP